MTNIYLLPGQAIGDYKNPIRAGKDGLFTTSNASREELEEWEKIGVLRIQEPVNTVSSPVFTDVKSNEKKR